MRDPHRLLELGALLPEFLGGQFLLGLISCRLQIQRSALQLRFLHQLLGTQVHLGLILCLRDIEGTPFKLGFLLEPLDLELELLPRQTVLLEPSGLLFAE